LHERKKTETRKKEREREKVLAHRDIEIKKEREVDRE